MPRRWCQDCDQLFTASDTGTMRCTNCQAAADQRDRDRRATAASTRRRPGPRRRGYTTAYERARKQLLATATTCHWCGHPFTADDPATADHLTPVSQGGTHADGMVAAHRSCNSRRGGQLRRARCKIIF